MKKFATFLAVSIAVLAVYEICLGEISTYWPSKMHVHTVWILLHTAVPFVISAGIAWVLGIWRSEYAAVTKVIAMIWCVALPPFMAVLYIDFACEILRACI